MLTASFAIIIIAIVLCNVILDYTKIMTFASWFIYAIITTLIVGIIAAMVYVIFYKEDIKSIIGRFTARS